MQLLLILINRAQHHPTRVPYINAIVKLNKNTLGVKKVRGQSEAVLQTGATKNFDIS